MSVTPPGNSHRTAIVGRTGSGKTVFGLWYLRKMLDGPWFDMPVTIIDPKRSKMIAQIVDAGAAKRIDMRRKPPENPGLYVISPSPGDDDDDVQVYLRRIYDKGSHGLYVDETLDLGPRNRGFRRLLTQGRELEIPMIYLMQRPAWCDQYSFSEADYFAVFHLSKDDDVKKLQKEIKDYNPKELGKYCCYWYDVGSDEGVKLRPVDRSEAIISMYANADQQQFKREKVRI